MSSAVNASNELLWSLSGDFVDDRDQHISLSSMRGTQTIVAMEYTECRFICSAASRKLLEIQAAADRLKQSYRFVIISIDPEHDSPTLWREYRRVRSLQRDNWVFLTGSPALTNKVAATLGVRWWRDDAGNIMHDLRILRFDAQGRLVKTMDEYGMLAKTFLGD